MASVDQHPFHPIIYVRGFAMTQAEIEDAVADPYMGFNLGSTMQRQWWTGEIRKFVFESPLVRLMKEHQYSDVYVDGESLLDGAQAAAIPYRSLIIHRYYEQSSKLIGSGTAPKMEDHARQLSDLILRLRDCCVAGGAKAADFRCYLVAHSMGGLICRAFLQNPKLGSAEARATVDKAFTYATPHNGIDAPFNVPGWFTFGGADNFNRPRMAEYLGLQAAFKQSGDVMLLKGFDPDRFFCLIGTNSRDYKVLYGASALAAGDQSDGLVRIANAAVYGMKGKATVTAPRAFVHRSHSGYQGIVNSEEGYQNLVRFLFGTMRVDAILDIAAISLPAAVQKAKDAGKEIRASYQFETVASVRGAQWDLHRRLVRENSAIFRKYDDLFAAGGKPKPEAVVHLVSLFLDRRKRVDPQRPSLGFALKLAVRVPDYVVDGFLFLDHHYEGGVIFEDKLNVEVVPPSGEKATFRDWSVRYGWDSDGANQTQTTAELAVDDDGVVSFTVPVRQARPPGIEAKIRVVASRWNEG